MRLRPAPVRPATVVGCALVALALAATLTGCGTDAAPTATRSPSSSPTTTPTPTPDAAEVERAEDVAAASSLVTEFLAAADAVAQAGYTDLTPLTGSMAGQFRDDVLTAFGQYAAAGLREAGQTVVVGVDAVDHTPAGAGATGARVTLDVCLDVAGTSTVDASGAPVGAPADPARYVVTYDTYEEQDGHWWITATTPHPDRAC